MSYINPNIYIEGGRNNSRTQQYPFVSIIIVNYNGIEYLADCLSSVLNQTYKNYEVVFVDNDSSDGSIEYVGAIFPSVKIIKNKNTGYAGGNNRGIKSSKGSYIVFLNPDTLVEKDWLYELVKNAVIDEEVGACMSKILLFDEKEKLNSGGNVMNFLGFGYVGGYREIDRGQFKKREIPYAMGASMLIKKRIIDEVGAFDDDFFMYREDADLGWRIRLAGYKILFVSTSVVYHKYSFSRNPTKLYFYERNRLVVLLKNYGFKTILLILPIFFVMEIGMLLFFLVKKDLNSKIKTYCQVIKDINKILDKRRKVQKTRKVSDREIVKLFVAKIEFEEIKNPILTYITNPFLEIYWKIVKKFI